MTIDEITLSGVHARPDLHPAKPARRNDGDSALNRSRRPIERREQSVA
jgi:hypothetical protein